MTIRAWAAALASVLAASCGARTEGESWPSRVATGGSISFAAAAGGSSSASAGRSHTGGAMSPSSSTLGGTASGGSTSATSIPLPCNGVACPSPKVIASGQDGPRGIAVDQFYVYIANFGDGTVGRVSIETGAVTTLATHQRNAFGIAVAASHVYWTNTGVDCNVVTCMLDGSGLSTLASLTVPAYGIALDGAQAYFSTYSNSGSVMAQSLRVPGDPVVLVSNLNGPGRIALDADNVYFTIEFGDQVASVPKNGGAARTLASGQNGPVGLALDATNVYFTNSEGGTIMKVPKLGGAVTQRGIPGRLASRNVVECRVGRRKA